MTNYLVSVGVPVYNAEKYIERCVKSILSQSYENLEVVFVDDCSTDNSVSIIENTLKFYPHRKEQVRIIRHTSNQGVSVARNTLLSAFTGEFFSFVDADDYLMPDAIQLLVQKQKQDDSDLVTGTFRIDNGIKEELVFEPDFCTPDEMLFHIVSQQANHANVARLYRRSIIEENNIRYVEGMHMGEDWVFITNVILHLSSMSRIDEVIYIYDYTNESSAMHRLANNSVYAKYMLADTITCYEIKKLIALKSQKYIDALERMMALRIENGLLMAYKIKDRDTFSRIKHFIPEVAKKNVDKFFHFRKLYICNNIYPESYTIYFCIKRIIQLFN